MVGIPCMFEMKDLLEIWLGVVPQNTIYFGCTFLLMQIVDQLSGGLGLANRAIGDIRKYTLVTYSPKLLVVPLGWLSLHLGMPILVVCGIMILLEAICMVLRIYLLRNNEGFAIKDYIINVIFKPFVPCIISAAICCISVNVISIRFRFLLTFAVSVIIFIAVAYFVALTIEERKAIHRILGKKL
jgi:hypothetical protein